MEGGGYVSGAVEVVVGVDGEGGCVVRGLEWRWGVGVGYGG